jgi:hypothetical protein
MRFTIIYSDDDDDDDDDDSIRGKGTWVSKVITEVRFLVSSDKANILFSPVSDISRRAA